MRAAPSRRQRVLSVGLWVSLLAVAPGCEAAFEDLRPSSSPLNGGGDPADVGDSDAAGADGAADVAADGAADVDADALGDPAADGGPDGVGTEDVGDPDAPLEVTPVEDVVLAQGTFGGRMGYDGAGGATLVALAGGGYEMRFDSSFRAVAVPGPVVVLTYRPDIGSQLDVGQGDRELGTLMSNAGPQSYAVPEAGIDAMYVWVYCKPFGVEIARAELTEAP